MNPPATAWWYRPHDTKASNATSPTRYRVVVPTSLHESVKRYVTHPLPRGGTDLMTRERQRLRHPPATAWWYRPHDTKASKLQYTRSRIVVLDVITRDLMTRKRQTLRHPPATAWWYRPHDTKASKAKSPPRYRVVVPTS